MAENNEPVTDETPKEVEPSKENLAIAQTIVKYADVIERPFGYDVDMIGVVGIRYEAMEKTKAKALEAAAVYVAGFLERGELDLAKNWEHHFKKAK